MARLQEYSADQFAAKLVGRSAIGEALVRAAVGEAAWERAVATTLKQANHQPQVPADLFSQILAGLQQPQAAELNTTLFQQAFGVPTDVTDTHPSLRDRLMVLGYRREQIQPVAQPAETALQQYLGADWLAVQPDCDAAWSTTYAMAWQQQYHDFQSVNARLEAMATAALTNVLDALVYARKTLEWLGFEEAVPCYQAVLDLDPSNQSVHHELGLLLLAHGDDRGVAHLEAVIRIDPTRIVEICQDLYQYYRQSGNPALAEKYVGIAAMKQPVKRHR
ncbi:MAG: M48 family metalloprotease [Alkalinema sp. RL_2_19]|nr:M48 family metalloprotease [Alkalinema sp. RL_2_19]